MWASIGCACLHFDGFTCVSSSQQKRLGYVSLRISIRSCSMMVKGGIVSMHHDLSGGVLSVGCQRSQRQSTTHESRRYESPTNKASIAASWSGIAPYRYKTHTVCSNTGQPTNTPIQPPASNSAILLSTSGTPLNSTSNSSFSSSNFSLFSASSFAKTYPPWPSNCRIHP